MHRPCPGRRSATWGTRCHVAARRAAQDGARTSSPIHRRGRGAQASTLPTMDCLGGVCCCGGSLLFECAGQAVVVGARPAQGSVLLVWTNVEQLDGQPGDAAHLQDALDAGEVGGVGRGGRAAQHQHTPVLSLGSCGQTTRWVVKTSGVAVVLLMWGIRVGAMRWMICSGSFCSQTNQTVSPGLGSRAISVPLSQWRRSLRRALSSTSCERCARSSRRLAPSRARLGERPNGRAAFPACGSAQRLRTLACIGS
jgi:hypothetical protein